MKNDTQEGRRRKVIYKRIKVAMPHCNVCGEELRGYNSLEFPYECSCGTWEQSWTDLNYYIKN